MPSGRCGIAGMRVMQTALEFCSTMRQDKASQGVNATFAGANANHVIDVIDEDLAISDFAGFGGLHQRLDDSGELIVIHKDFHLGFWQKIHGVFAAAVDFSVSTLSAKAFDLCDSHAMNSCFSQRFMNFLEFMRFNNGFDFFHFGRSGFYGVTRDDRSPQVKIILERR